MTSGERLVFEKVESLKEISDVRIVVDNMYIIIEVI